MKNKNSQNTSKNQVDNLEQEFSEAEKVVENNELQQLQADYATLAEQLGDAKRREQLALADYQNLIRRTNEERGKIARLAARTFLEDLLQPLSHLSMASEQLNDAGLNMVVSQLWQALENNGLQKIDALGKEFDVSTMEATDTGKNGKKVVKIVRDGYLLNDEVIQHAKVILD